MTHDWLTSSTRIYRERRSSSTVARHAGAFSAEPTEDKTFFRISATLADDFVPGRMLWRLPVGAQHINDAWSLEPMMHVPVTLLMIFRLTLPSGVSSSSRVSSLRSLKSHPLLITRTSPLSSLAPKTSRDLS